MDNVKTVILVLLYAGMAGCSSNPNMPLIFTQSHTVGISIGAGANEQGADFVFGYKDKNIAIVPVTVQTGPDSFSALGSTAGAEFEDAFSVLGQFEVNTDTGQGNVGLGKFFATGAAAKALGDGFNCKLSGQDVDICLQRDAPVEEDEEELLEPDADENGAE